MYTLVSLSDRMGIWLCGRKRMAMWVLCVSNGERFSNKMEINARKEQHKFILSWGYRSRPTIFTCGCLNPCIGICCWTLSDLSATENGWPKKHFWFLLLLSSKLRTTSSKYFYQLYNESFGEIRLFWISTTLGSALCVHLCDHQFDISVNLVSNNVREYMIRGVEDILFVGEGYCFYELMFLLFYNLNDVFTHIKKNPF